MNLIQLWWVLPKNLVTKYMVHLGYGYMSFDKDPNYIAAYSQTKPRINKDLWQAWANVFYSPRKPLSFGLRICLW